MFNILYVLWGFLSNGLDLNFMSFLKDSTSVILKCYCLEFLQVSLLRGLRTMTSGLRLLLDRAMSSLFHASRRERKNKEKRANIEHSCSIQQICWKVPSGIKEFIKIRILLPCLSVCLLICKRKVFLFLSLELWKHFLNKPCVSFSK